MRDQISWTVQCCSCKGTFLWFTLTLVKFMVLPLLLCSWKKNCSQGLLKLRNSLIWLLWCCTSFLMSLLWVKPGMVEQPQPWSQGFHWFRRNPFTPYTKVLEGGSWQFLLHAFVCEIVTEKGFWKSGDLCPENLWGEYKAPEKAGKLFRQVFWEAGFKQVPEAQNFQHSKASSSAKAGEGNVKWC